MRNGNFMKRKKHLSLSFDTRIITHCAMNISRLKEIRSRCLIKGYKTLISDLVKEESINKLETYPAFDKKKATKSVEKVINNFKMSLKKHSKKDVRKGYRIRKKYNKGKKFKKDAEIIAHLKRIGINVVLSTDSVFVNIADKEKLNTKLIRFD